MIPDTTNTNSNTNSTDNTCSSALSSLYQNMLDTKCKPSYNTVCNSIYTDNPPFACTKSQAPSFASIFSDAFAGTEFIYILYSAGMIVVCSYMLPTVFGESVLHPDEIRLKYAKYLAEQDALGLEVELGVGVPIGVGVDPTDVYLTDGNNNNNNSKSMSKQSSPSSPSGANVYFLSKSQTNGDTDTTGATGAEIYFRERNGKHDPEVGSVSGSQGSQLPLLSELDNDNDIGGDIGDIGDIGGSMMQRPGKDDSNNNVAVFSSNPNTNPNTSSGIHHSHHHKHDGDDYSSIGSEVSDW